MPGVRTGQAERRFVPSVLFRRVGTALSADGMRPSRRDEPNPFHLPRQSRPSSQVLIFVVDQQHALGFALRGPARWAWAVVVEIRDRHRGPSNTFLSSFDNLNVDLWCANRRDHGGRLSPARTGVAMVSPDTLFELLRRPFANHFEDLSPQSRRRLFRRCRRTLP